MVTCGALMGLHYDDRYLLRALLELGVSAEPAVWEDPHYDWSQVKLALIRSAWDYAWRRSQFLSWAERAARETVLWNRLRIVEWNTHKRYLCDLAERGVPVVPTVLLPAGSQADLGELAAARGWETLVIKAAVAQSGRYAKLVPRDRLDEGQAHLRRLLPYEDLLVQPFVSSVPRRGEWSLVYIEGSFTHAVHKVAPCGDFRVHDDYGGSVTEAPLQRDQVAVAEGAVAAVGEPVHYARVDLVAGPDGTWWVMELEVVEPELFLRFSREAVNRLAQSIVDSLSSRVR